MSATPPGRFVAAIDLQSAVESVPQWVWLVTLVVGIGSSIVVLYCVARPGGRWGRRLRSRFVLGVPWGTLLALATVLAVYLFVQGGLAHRHDPVSLPFRATSYAYPLGILLGAVSHLGWGHLLGNLLSGLVYGSIAEYAWGHFPSARGDQSFSWLATHPFVRIGVWYMAILLVGLATAAFSWGPIIGFSGVVYALAGFALVSYPIATVVAVAGWNLLYHLYRAIEVPYTIAEPDVVYSGIGWANVAVQGHVFGFLIGVIAGSVVVWHRQRSVSPGRVWLAAVIYMIANGLWSVFWYLGNNRFIRLRALGTALVFVLVGLIVAVAARSGRSLRDDLPRAGAVAVLVTVLLSMAFLGAVVNLSAPSNADLPDDAIEVRDYEVAYAEDVTNQQLAVVDIPLLEQATTVRTSGVVVYSDRRNLWHQVITKRALEARGSGRVLLGGIGWRQPVDVYRSGWSVVGGNVTYRVFLQPDGGDARLVYTSEPAVADLTLANRTVALQPAEDAFEIRVARANETIGAHALPPDGGNVSVGGIRFDRSGGKLHAAINGTELQVASRRVPPTRE